MILIIDFGSQFNQLIARRIREKEVFCQIISPNQFDMDLIKKQNIKGIIFSGGPSSIYEKNSPKIKKEIFDAKIPILGICYGMQLMVNLLGGEVASSKKREYGFAELEILDKETIFEDVPEMSQTWMSHGDSTVKIPKDFKIIASTKNTKIASIYNKQKKFYGFQFHPEVAHTKFGEQMLSNFLFKICKVERNWTMQNFVKEEIQKIKDLVQDQKVILGLSGGVDSSVAALLIHKAIGKKLFCISVDNGLLRKNEIENLKDMLKNKLGLNIKFVNAKNEFLSKLKNISNPEKKRKIIGNVFIKIFEKEAKKIKGASFLAQGTLYPDLIESESAFGGPSSIIKSHHNVGGLPKKMKLKLIEPLKYLFKDEVRILGAKLGLDKELIERQPFPGPGLAIRIVGDINAKKLKKIKEADFILLEEIKKQGYYNKLWQSFAILLPVKSVGIMGDKRSYDETIVIRAVNSQDAMTADWAKLPYDLLGKVSNRIMNEVQGITRVLYDISSKPPSTIEWE